MKLNEIADFNYKYGVILLGSGNPGKTKLAFVGNNLPTLVHTAFQKISKNSRNCRVISDADKLEYWTNKRRAGLSPSVAEPHSTVVAVIIERSYDIRDPSKAYDAIVGCVFTHPKLRMPIVVD